MGKFGYKFSKNEKYALYVHYENIIEVLKGWNDLAPRNIPWLFSHFEAIQLDKAQY